MSWTRWSQKDSVAPLGFIHIHPHSSIVSIVGTLALLSDLVPDLVTCRVLIILNLSEFLGGRRACRGSLLESPKTRMTGDAAVEEFGYRWHTRFERHWWSWRRSPCAAWARWSRCVFQWCSILCYYTSMLIFLEFSSERLELRAFVR
jgi:hypothetical protein